MSEYPPFRLTRIRQSLGEVYRLFGLTMPEVTVAPDLFAGYELARAEAPGVAREACRCALEDSQWGTGLSVSFDAIWSLCWEDTLLINQERFAAAISQRGASRSQKTLFDAEQFVGQSSAFAAAYSDAKRAVTTTPVNRLPQNAGLPHSVSQYIAACFRWAHADGLAWYFPLDSRLILVPMPRMIQDSDNRLHSEQGPALAWERGAKFHFLHGVWFPEEAWRDIVDRKLRVAALLGIAKIEQRRAAIQAYGFSEIVKRVGVLLEKKQGYELFLVHGIFPIDAYFLKYRCPSTGRAYVSGIDPAVGETGSVLRAVQWKFRLPDIRDDKLFTAES